MKIVLVLLFLCAGGALATQPDCMQESAVDQSWCLERKERQRDFDKYYQDHKAGGDALVNGASGVGPVPMVFFRLFTELFPEIWGSPEENYFPIGLMKDEADLDNPLPLGMAYSVTEEKLWALGGKTVRINNAGFNCIACHSSQYRDDKGQLHHILGAPSTRVDNSFFYIR